MIYDIFKKTLNLKILFKLFIFIFIINFSFSFLLYHIHKLIFKKILVILII